MFPESLEYALLACCARMENVKSDPGSSQRGVWSEETRTKRHNRADCHHIDAEMTQKSSCVISGGVWTSRQKAFAPQLGQNSQEMLRLHYVHDRIDTVARFEFGGEWADALFRNQWQVAYRWKDTSEI